MTFLGTMLPPAGLLPSSLNQDRAVVSCLEGTASVLAPPDWIKLNPPKSHIQAGFRSTLRWRAVLHWFLPVPNHITLLLLANSIPIQTVHNSVHNYGDTKLRRILPKILDYEVQTVLFDHIKYLFFCVVTNSGVAAHSGIMCQTIPAGVVM